MLRKNLIVYLFLTIVMIACQPAEESGESATVPETSNQADEAAIRKVFKQMEETWNAADLEALMAFIAEDVVQMPPNRPTIEGKEALRSDWENFLSENTDIWKPSIEHIEVSGNLAVVRRRGTESWTPKTGGETITQAGKGITVFRRGSEGSLKMILEIWNAREPVD